MTAIKENVALAPYTVYQIGGPARFFVEVKNLDELREALEFGREKHTGFMILGAGSNMLISDKGFDGVAIHMTGGNIKTEGERLTADAGVRMARAAAETAKAGLSGFEWGIGIPGTIGGSVRGNAGCFGGEMKNAVEKVSIFKIRPLGGFTGFARRKQRHLLPTQFSKIEELNNQQCRFGYRDSIFKQHPDWIIFSATLKFKKGDPAEIQARIREVSRERAEKQDIGTQSCGCIFKNVPWTRKDIHREKLLARFPELAQFADMPNIPASYLIDQTGLKNKRVGRVSVSPRHANYFVNDGGATAEEVVMLIGLAKDAVRRKFRILLEEEIQYVGF